MADVSIMEIGVLRRSVVLVEVRL
ncbi:hypothetical protein XFF6992_180059 [Xanthomonas citri pv. fuscans]|nr:hypothetical protein XFF6992_180059 [Xanthomonas citri pv. fuscans]